MNYRIISIENFVSNISEYKIIDVRERKDYNKYHIPGAVNIEFETIMSMSDFTEFFSKKDKIVIYCENGGRSLYATAKLGKMGYEVYSLSGGMRMYQKYNYRL